MSRLPELHAKVDAFFARVEADAIRAEVGGWTAERKAELADNVAGASQDRCAALTPGGRCLVYAARPIVCRSHGAPIRLRSEGSLPVVVSCVDNFTERGAAAADPDCVMDQTTLSAMVLAVDRDAGNDGERFDLAAVLADC